MQYKAGFFFNLEVESNVKKADKDTHQVFKARLQFGEGLSQVPLLEAEGGALDDDGLHSAVDHLLQELGLVSAPKVG